MSKTEDIDVIIEPGVYNVECAFFARDLKIECYVEITYQVIFHSQDMKHTASWLITGVGSVTSGGLKSLEKLVREATWVSMRDVAAKCIVGLCKQEQIRQILYGQCK